MSTPIDTLLKLLVELSATYRLWIKTAHVRRLRLAIDWAERYMEHSEAIDSYVYAENAKEERRYRRLRETARKKFFKYNQG